MESFIKYIIQGDDEIKKQDEHYEYCKNNNIPYITAMNDYKGHFRIDVDLADTDFMLDDDGEKQIKEIQSSYFKNNTIPLEKQIFSPPTTSGFYINSVKKENVEEICNKFFDECMNHKIKK